MTVECKEAGVPPQTKPLLDEVCLFEMHCFIHIHIGCQDTKMTPLWCVVTPQMLHSIFFLGKVNEPTFSPESILVDADESKKMYEGKSMSNSRARKSNIHEQKSFSPKTFASPFSRGCSLLARKGVFYSLAVFFGVCISTSNWLQPRGVGVIPRTIEAHREGLLLADSWFPYTHAPDLRSQILTLIFLHRVEEVVPSGL